ncbi:hypothetical protein CRYUN_Cryun05aG0193900 [Craigia yunnanensis]
MAPTATRRLRNCYRRREVERDSSLESSMELPCSHIGSISSSSSSSSNDSSSRNSIAADKEDHSNGVEVLQAGCSTPKGQRFRMPEILSCPPAPMKLRVAPKFLSRRSSAITFFSPPDIELFFFLAFQNVSASISH